MKKIKLTIQEIVKDFYSLGEQEGYISGLAEGFELSEKDKNDYEYFLKNMINKYLPNWEEHINKDYFNKELDSLEKNLILSIELYENFKNIFYQLI